MARWIMLGLTILGFAIVFTTRSPGLLGLGILIGLVGFIGFVFALAADRVSASARPEATIASVDDIHAMRGRRPGRPPTPVPPPVGPAPCSAPHGGTASIHSASGRIPHRFAAPPHASACEAAHNRCVALRDVYRGRVRVTIESIIIFLVVGAIAGWLAGQMVKGHGSGLVGNIVVAIVGAFLAGFLLPRLGFAIGGGLVAAIINALIGAVILLVLIGLFKRAT